MRLLVGTKKPASIETGDADSNNLIRRRSNGGLRMVEVLACKCSDCNAFQVLLARLLSSGAIYFLMIDSMKLT